MSIIFVNGLPKEYKEDILYLNEVGSYYYNIGSGDISELILKYGTADKQVPDFLSKVLFETKYIGTSEQLGVEERFRELEIKLPTITNSWRDEVMDIINYCESITSVNIRGGK